MVPVMRARFPLLAATLAAAVMFPSDPMAYVASGPTWSVPQMRYSINAANLDLPVLSVETAVRSGANVWDFQSAAFRFVYAGASSQTTTTNDGINLVLFRQRFERLGDRHDLLVVQRHANLRCRRAWCSGMVVPVFCRVERCSSGFSSKTCRARVRPRARARPLDIHERDDVSLGLVLQHGKPDAGCRRHRRRQGALPLAAALGAKRIQGHFVAGLQSAAAVRAARGARGRAARITRSRAAG